MAKDEQTDDGERLNVGREAARPVKEAETGRRALRAAREVAHLATSMASEAATLARILESHGASGAESIRASQASIAAAKSAFEIDGLVLGTQAPSLPEVVSKAEASVDAALLAIQAAKAALAVARTGRSSVDHGAGAGAL